MVRNQNYSSLKILAHTYAFPKIPDIHKSEYVRVLSHDDSFLDVCMISEICVHGSNLSNFYNYFTNYFRS